MTAADLSLVLSAVAATLTAVGGVIAGVVLLIRELHKTRAELVENTKQTAEIHTIVNQQRTDMVEHATAQTARIDSLVDTLRAAGLEVPRTTAIAHLIRSY